MTCLRYIFVVLLPYPSLGSIEYSHVCLSNRAILSSPSTSFLPLLRFYRARKRKMPHRRPIHMFIHYSRIVLSIQTNHPICFPFKVRSKFLGQTKMDTFSIRKKI